MLSNNSRAVRRTAACFLLSYALVIGLFAPFAARRVKASPGGLVAGAKNKTVTLPAAPANRKSGRREGELLVRFRDGVSEQDKAIVFGSHGARRKKQLRGESGVEKLELSSGQDAKSAADLMRLNPQVEFVEPNFLINHDQLRPNPLVSGMGHSMPAAGDPSSTFLQSRFYETTATGAAFPNLTGAHANPAAANPNLTNSANLNPQNQPGPNDPRFSEQWALRNTGQTGGHFGSDIDVATAWQTTTGSRSTVIAVIDSGIDFAHPDLVNNEWTNLHPGTNGDLHGWDYITDTGVIKDEQGHGTSIAGIIAAQGNNATGISGVMWSASLMSLRVLDNTGTGDVADAVEAIDYAVTHGAHVINLSWGTTEESVVLKDAIRRALRRGVIVICSAGNDGLDVDVTPYYITAAST